MVYYRRIILYFDGASRSNPHGPAGCGYRIVEMDDFGADGYEIVEGYRYLGMNYSNNQAEYQGLIEGLQVIQNDIEFETLYIRGDSEIVINQLDGEYQVRSDRIKPVYDFAINILEDWGWDYSLKWIPRSKNYRADELANMAIDNSDGSYQYWF